MSRKLSYEERHQDELMREDRQREKKAVSDKELDDRCYEILRILRDANHPHSVTSFQVSALPFLFLLFLVLNPAGDKLPTEIVLFNARKIVSDVFAALDHLVAGRDLTAKIGKPPRQQLDVIFGA